MLGKDCASTVAPPASVSVTVTSAPTSAVPLIEGWSTPVVVPAIGGLAMVTAGGVVSMVKVCVSVADPPVVVTVAVRVKAPSPKRTPGVKPQVPPAALTVRVKTLAPPPSRTSIWTWAPGVAVPEMVGGFALVSAPSAGCASSTVRHAPPSAGQV